MGEIRASFFIDHVNFAANGGRSIISNTPSAALAADPLHEVENRIVQVSGEWQGIRERMAHYKVPGVSLAIVKNNQVAWATTYGLVEAGGSNWVHADTTFQAASCSKPVTSLGFLRLAQDGVLGLDENMKPKLGWDLPRRACASASWEPKVTLRRLLQHRGGIIGRGATNPTDACSGFSPGGGGGFGGYADVAGVGVPNTIEVLNGRSSRPGVSVNSHRVELVYDPGSMSAYSGEGFVLMQQLLEHQRGVALRDWMAAHVLAPAGMTRSTYSLIAPSFSGPPAAGHGSGGGVITGKRNRYPESSAAGLYTTATDLCRYVIAINQSGTIGGQQLIDKARYTVMMSEGLGMPTGNVGTADEWFTHNGANAGFRCMFKGYPGKKAGFVILTNGDAGDSLYGEVVSALVKAYGWE